MRSRSRWRRPKTGPSRACRRTCEARWEWVRWVNATKNPDTRKRRVAVSLSKMKNGKRRPCWFNLSACTDPDLAKNGKLVAPE
ncbi:MAG TPA: YdeI/OmpD-associated family protein [Gemmatimonadales bacterium]|nr:YdeI/OmpD-associated family protein [Gemmatimonadales bacterium]